MTLTANVVDGQIILASWGNTIRDRTFQRFASNAERDSQWPAATAGKGARCTTTDVGAEWLSTGTVWIQPGLATAVAIPATSGIGTGTSIIPGSGFALPSLVRRYVLSILVAGLKNTAPGDVTIAPNGVGSFAQLLKKMTAPESGTLAGSWLISGYGSGSFTITVSAGTFDIYPGGQVIVTDAGAV